MIQKYVYIWNGTKLWLISNAVLSTPPHMCDGQLYLMETSMDCFTTVIVSSRDKNCALQQCQISSFNALPSAGSAASANYAGVFILFSLTKEECTLCIPFNRCTQWYWKKRAFWYLVWNSIDFALNHMKGPLFSCLRIYTFRPSVQVFSQNWNQNQKSNQNQIKIKSESNQNQKN